jgi:hypothetical protein
MRTPFDREVSRSVITLDSYSGEAWFDSRPGHLLSRMTLFVILIISPTQTLKICHDYVTNICFRILYNSSVILPLDTG